MKGKGKGMQEKGGAKGKGDGKTGKGGKTGGGKGPKGGCWHCGGDHYASKCPKGAGRAVPTYAMSSADSD